MLSEDDSTRVLKVDPAKVPHQGLLASLLEEMIQRYQKGERPRAEEFLARYPDFQNHSEVVTRLVYEEVCQRRAGGDTVSPGEILNRFPKWWSQLEGLLNFPPSEILASTSSVFPPLPPRPDSLKEFRLVAELGRGVEGKVYLATQPSLADRPVVLKWTTNRGHEHLSLARLQHTYIVPLLSVHDDPQRDLRVLCMPYFGGTTLKHILDELENVPVAQRTGRLLLEILDRLEVKFPVTGQGQGPARKLLARISYVQAVCWLGACLAEGLQFAHDRGFVHLDVKPSNVLLTVDGQPMLLDFHLAQPPLEAGNTVRGQVGGTPAYMAPEQRTTFDALNAGLPVPRRVDGRSDVFSLGLLLKKMLGVSPPLEQTSPSKETLFPPEVTPGLQDLLQKCLAEEPGNRYAQASLVAEDLRRHLEHRLLRGVRNRSVVESWRKWRRRRPFALPLLMVSVLLLGTALRIGLAAWNREQDKRHQAETALIQGRQFLDRRDYAQAVDVLERGILLANDLNGSSDLQQQLYDLMHQAQRGRIADNLHVLADRFRFFYGEAFVSPSQGQTLLGNWHALWDKRGTLLDKTRSSLDPEIEQRLKTDLLDLGLIGADLTVRLASPSQKEIALKESLEVLQELETSLGPSLALFQQRQAYAVSLGDPSLAERTRERIQHTGLRTAWEHYALGRWLLMSGHPQQAAPLLDRAVDLEPQGFWPNFFQGICRFRLGQYDEAATAFRVCTALVPDSAECYYNWGLARAIQGRPGQALPLYHRALQHNPGLAPAALNRGLLYLERKQYKAAEEDLRTALANGSDPAQVHYNLALVYLAKDELSPALQHIQLALQANTNHVQARALQKQLQAK